MAFTTTNARPLNAVRIVSRADDAVDHEASDWDEYMDDAIKNAASLKMKPGKSATYFLCNFQLTGKESARIKDAMIKGVDRDSNEMNMSYGRWAYTVAKLTLKDIQNPPNVDGIIEYKKDGTGYVLDSVLDVLESAGVVQEIFNHWVALTQNKDTIGHEKN